MFQIFELNFEKCRSERTESNDRHRPLYFNKHNKMEAFLTGFQPCSNLSPAENQSLPLFSPKFFRF